MSAILPLCDGFLGISMSSEALGAMLKAFEQYMPAPHRDFLDDVRRRPLRPLIVRLREAARRAGSGVGSSGVGSSGGGSPASLSATADTGGPHVSPSPSGGRGGGGGEEAMASGGGAAGVGATAGAGAGAAEDESWPESVMATFEGDEAFHEAAVESLVDHYNAVVRRVLDFRWRHLSYIEEYVIKPSGGMATARGTGGTPAFAYLNQHINDTEAALIPTLTSSPLLRPPAAHAPPDWKLPAAAFAEAALTAHAGQRLGAEHAAAGELWAVTDERGLLPARPPLDLDGLPAAWRAAVRLLRRLPGACVPPPTFRSLVAAAAACGDFPPPAAVAALPSEDSAERARCVTAFLLAGWRAAKPPPQREPPALTASPEAHRRSYAEGGAAARRGWWCHRHPRHDDQLDDPAAHDDAPPHTTADRDNEETPPAPLLDLHAALCGRVGRPSRVGVAELFLYNWRLLPPLGGDEPAEGEGEGEGEGGAEGEGDRPSLRRMRRVVPCQRFVCFEEEDWFVRLHVTLAGEAGRLVEAARHCVGARDTNEQVRALQSLEGALETLVRVHYVAGIGQAPGADAPKVTPALLMGRMHRFLPPSPPELGLASEAEARAVRVYCASGIDQPMVLHLLGVHRGGHAIGRFREWQASADLPTPHRAFLADVRCCTPMRERVEAAVGGERLAVQELARLELAHNSCIDMALRLFTRRYELVRALLGVDALATSWQHERGLIQEARLRLLVERREMQGPRRGLPTRAHAYKREPTERGR